MSELIPTRIGDVLIEHKAGTLFHVGAISWDGQQRLPASYDRLTSRPAALAAAKNLMLAGRKIYLRNTIGQWRELQP
jgi:hypothetical protein